MTQQPSDRNVGARREHFLTDVSHMQQETCLACPTNIRGRLPGPAVSSHSVSVHQERMVAQLTQVKAMQAQVRKAKFPCLSPLCQTCIHFKVLQFFWHLTKEGCWKGAKGKGVYGVEGLVNDQRGRCYLLTIFLFFLDSILLRHHVSKIAVNRGAEHACCSLPHMPRLLFPFSTDSRRCVPLSQLQFCYLPSSTFCGATQFLKYTLCYPNLRGKGEDILRINVLISHIPVSSASSLQSLFLFLLHFYFCPCLCWSYIL